MKPRDVLIALSIPTIFGFGFVLAKAALDHFPPIFLMAIRFSLSALALIWFVPVPRAHLKHIVLIAIVGGTLQYSLVYSALRDLYASTAALAIQIEVPFAALLAAIFLKDHLGWRRLAGTAIAFLGIAIIAGEPRLEGNLLPLFLMLAGAFSWAASQVMIKTLGPIGGFTLIAWIAALSTPFLFASSYVLESNQIEAIRTAGPEHWFAVLYLGLFMTTVGYAMWYYILAKYSVNQVMPFNLLMPITSVAAGMLLLGEEPAIDVFLGGAVLLVGVAIILIRRPRLATPGPEGSADP